MCCWESNRWGIYRRKTRVEESLALETAAYCHIPAGTVLNANWGEDNQIKVKRTGRGLFLAHSAAKSDEVVAEALILTFNNKSNRWYWICRLRPARNLTPQALQQTTFPLPALPQPHIS